MLTFSGTEIALVLLTTVLALMLLLLVYSQRQKQQAQLAQQATLEQANVDLQSELSNLSTEHAATQTEVLNLKVENAALQEKVTNQNVHFQERLQAIKESEQHLKSEFENLANRIFQEKNEQFTVASKTSLTALVQPLQKEIADFKLRMEQQSKETITERTTLKNHIESLQKLNQQLNAEAKALTSALKGDNKQQGNWGEVVLETILQESGLREGLEYRKQASLKSDEGKRFQPDIIIDLPNKKQIVIDAKVSLVSYEQYFHTTDTDEKNRLLKAHLDSIKQHIKGLSEKNYQQLHGIDSLDYVLLFIPIEPAFYTAMDADHHLIEQALQKNIMLVSPNNLMLALRTINNLWQTEHQYKNAQKIAEDAGKLYDKFVGFTTDMQKMGNAIDTLTKTYASGMNKLKDGRGSIIKRAEDLRQLGVKPTKQLPWVDDEAGREDD